MTHTAAVLRTEASIRSQSDHAHQRAFAVVLDTWADNFDRRAAEERAGEQPDLFGEAA